VRTKHGLKRSQAARSGQARCPKLTAFLNNAAETVSSMILSPHRSASLDVPARFVTSRERAKTSDVAETSSLPASSRCATDSREGWYSVRVGMGRDELDAVWAGGDDMADRE